MRLGEADRHARGRVLIVSPAGRGGRRRFGPVGGTCTLDNNLCVICHVCDVEVVIDDDEPPVRIAQATTFMEAHSEHHECLTVEIALRERHSSNIAVSALSTSAYVKAKPASWSRAGRTR